MIVLRLDRVLADRKMRSKELAEKIGLTEVNLSRIKTGKISAVRFSTLDAICRALDCQPGDILEYVPDGGDRPEGAS
ncbi:helix-turn-helix domain-containing protein [Thermophilibacter provencensis]|uniref:Helix-turn-helix transcriptional regulator n=1 Tax=Thermophilibacter provencensis TaxID=1852386 RepID=A0ABT7V5B9_9ACTN|nr:helix-turn-helix transcriptional regulator [Thermophilibacter provencensis]MDM8271797.1 helix-turn-helix transcriptional regulator [Thermophilibacter provencensis]